jgi:hypothetical protein
MHDGENRPLSEIYAEAGEDWSSKEAAAQLLEETKSAIMAQKQSMLPEMPVNRAEQIVKASPDWYEHIEKIVEARRVANLAKIELEVIRMRFNEQNNIQANARLEMKMTS